MTNPYFLPADIDGSPRRPIVERVEMCRPTEEFYPLTPRNDGAGKWGWKVNDDGRDDEWLATLVVPGVALRLTRLAVIEWLQQQHSDWEGDGPHERVYASIAARLKWGDEDSRYNELCHRLADALGVSP